MIKPILFNTDMVRAILDERKTVTRRCVKYKYSNTEMKMHTDKYGTRLIEIQKDVEGETFGKNPDGSTWHKLLGYVEPNPPYKQGDILYVRESGIIQSMKNFDKAIKLYFPADESLIEFKVTPDEYERLSKFQEDKKLSPYWLTKQESRIWLKVKDVRVERLQCMSWDDICNEGIIPDSDIRDKFSFEMLQNKFKNLWNSTIKKSDIDRYGWDANPYVWVIEFERCEKPEDWR